MDSSKKVALTGITILYEPKDADQCSADVVFVHGLQGHPRRTWTAAIAREPAQVPRTTKKRTFGGYLTFSKSIAPELEPAATTESPQLDVFWPKDLLAEDCDTARIMTWGYDSDVTKFFSGPVNQNTFYDHAKDLLADLNRHRSSGRGRPLIFVAHSLGGIIVKQVLFASKLAEGRRELLDIYNSTKALLFLGTPHRGSDYAAWGKIAERIASVALFDTNARNLEHLSVNGEHLAQLAQNFEGLLYHRTFSIYSYQEAKGYKGVKLLNDKVVEPWSSVVGDPGRESVQTINANHMDMCRFNSKDDPGYRKIGTDIQLIVRECLQELHERLAQEHAGFLKSLTLPELGGAHIVDPYNNTAQWLLYDARFQAWLHKEHGLFWVKGKPGSGKSTLMKSMWLSPKLDSILAGGPKFTKAAFFFNARGTTLEKGATSMLKGLLYQFLESSKDLYKLLLPDLRQIATGPPRKPPESIYWDRKALTSVMLKLISRAVGVRIILFIDALDESIDEDRDIVICSLEQIVEASRKSGLILDIIFSSRPDTSIDISRCRYICLEDENRSDIAFYVEHELVSRANERRKINRHHELAQQVMKKADGVFLWVYLVVPRLRRHINRGDTLGKLLKILDDIPTQLEELFKDILMRIGSDCLPETMRMIQLAVLAQRPLELDEFRHALAFGPDCKHYSFEEWEKSEDYVEDGEQMIQRVQSRSGGLLEVRADYKGRISDQSEDSFPLQVGTTSQPWSQIPCRMSQHEHRDSGTYESGRSKVLVLLIHETAKNYFLKGEGFTQLMSLIQSTCGNVADSRLYHSPSGCFQTGGHDYIVKSCLRYFEIREVRWAWRMLAIRSVILTPLDRKLFPFVQYVLESWLYHICQAEQGGLSQAYIPQLVIDYWPYSTDQLIIIAAEHNLLTWLSWFNDHKIVDFDTPNFWYGGAIQKAVAGGHKNAVAILLQGGANVNGTTGGFQTTLARAVLNKDKEMMAYLYMNGATMSQMHWLPPQDTAVHITPPPISFCHECGNIWYSMKNYACLNCKSDFTEPIEQ